MLFAALFTIALAIVAFAPAQAADLSLNSQLSTLSSAAQPPFYSTSEFWAGLFAVVTGIVAIWKNNQASTGAKINETLILAIEQATKLPGVSEHEQRIKRLIQSKATELGVHPLLHRLVQDLTEPAAKPDSGGAP